MAKRKAPDPDVQLILTVKDGDVVEVWLREGMSGAALAGLLRKAAGEFETGDVRRIG